MATSSNSLNFEGVDPGKFVKTHAEMKTDYEKLFGTPDKLWRKSFLGIRLFLHVNLAAILLDNSVKAAWLDIFIAQANVSVATGKSTKPIVERDTNVKKYQTKGWEMWLPATLAKVK